jgi:outer membrane protein TolC
MDKIKELERLRAMALARLAKGKANQSDTETILAEIDNLLSELKK